MAGRIPLDEQHARACRPACAKSSSVLRRRARSVGRPPTSRDTIDASRRLRLERRAMGNRLSKIYTRTGDDGTTGLANGERIDKADPVSPPSATSTRRTARSACCLRSRTFCRAISASLARIQHELFEIGAELSLPGLSADHGRARQPARARPRRAERRAAAAEGVRAARRNARRRGLPSRSHDLPARRAQRLGGEQARWR